LALAQRGIGAGKRSAKPLVGGGIGVSSAPNRHQEALFSLWVLMAMGIAAGATYLIRKKDYQLKKDCNPITRLGILISSARCKQSICAKPTGRLI
jgi:hypothetical protein